MTALVIILYAECSALAFLLMVDDWRRSWPVTTGDAAAFATLSLLGPAALITALLLWFPSNDQCRVLWDAKR